MALFGNLLKTRMVTREDAMPGSPTPLFRVPERHAVLGTPLRGPWAEGTEVLYVAMGCFWGAERTFWRQPGVVATAAGYMGGFTENPTYEDTLTGRTGHTETVMVAYDPQQTSAEQLLKVFWESHDPTQGMRQGNDVGTTYRSAVYWTTDEQRSALERTQAAVEPLLRQRGYGAVTTEERPAAEAGTFWYAEGYHQQYLEKNPGGYCGLGGTGVTCPVGVVGA